MKKHSMLKAVSAVVMSALFIPVLAGPLKVSAAEDTPKVIFSTIDGEDVEISLEKAISKESTGRTWYCNDAEVVLDESHIDTSEGTTARLKLIKATTRNHMENYKCVDSEGSLEEADVARLYVISKDNYENAELMIKDMEASSGMDLYAKDITLYIDKTPYPNFAPLKFVEDGKEVDKVRVKKGTNTYSLVDTVFKREVEAVITGVGDEIAPTIKYLKIKDDLADKFAFEKTVEALASDEESGLPDDAYYFEKDEKLSSAVKLLVVEGASADDLLGITWSKDTEYVVTDNGTYTLFVRDKAGNVAYKDINVSKISTSSPSITEVSLGKEDEKPYLYVVAKDPDNQPLMYKLNDGKWQESDKLFDLKEGDNFVVVKNEAGVVTSLKKYVYLSLYTGKEEGLSEKSLYNYIKVSPASWTNGSVSVSLVLPDSIIEKLSVSPYSINGAAFSANRTKTVSANEETVQFTVKDIYGNTHTSQVYTVTNIDKEKPSLEVVSKSGSFAIKAADSGSGIAKITVSSSSASNYVIKANSSDKVSSDNATYKAPSNGTYQFTVYDYAGNTTTVSGTMSYYTKENGKVQTAAKSSGTTTKTSSTTSKSSAATTKSSSKTSTASVDKKEAEEEKSSSATLGAKKDTEKKDNKKTASKDVSSEPVVVKEERRIISNAGNSVSPDLPEAEKIEVIREQDPALSSPPQMQTTEKLDNTNEKRLKGLVILIIAASAAAVLVAIWVNSGKGREKNDFSFRK